MEITGQFYALDKGGEVVRIVACCPCMPYTILENMLPGGLVTLILCL